MITNQLITCLKWIAITEIKFFDHIIVNLTHHGVEKFLSNLLSKFLSKWKIYRCENDELQNFPIRVLCSGSFVLIRIRVEIYQWIYSDGFNNSFTESTTHKRVCLKKNLGERFITIIEPLMKFLFSLSWALFVVAQSNDQSVEQSTWWCHYKNASLFKHSQRYLKHDLTYPNSEV